jgi:hypothetical protein
VVVVGVEVVLLNHDVGFSIVGKKQTPGSILNRALIYFFSKISPNVSRSMSFDWVPIDIAAIFKCVVHNDAAKKQTLLILPNIYACFLKKVQRM